MKRICDIQRHMTLFAQLHFKLTYAEKTHLLSKNMTATPQCKWSIPLSAYLISNIKKGVKSIPQW